MRGLLTITPEFRALNYGEAGLWALMALIVFVTGLRRTGPLRNRCLLFAGTLLAFGASDVVEANTGAWWRPWWLLVWKGACVLVIAGLWLNHLAWRRRRRG